MGDCPANYKSVSEDVGGFGDSSNTTPDRAFGDIEGLSSNDLRCHFADNLKTGDGEDSKDKSNSDTLKEDVSKDSHGSNSGSVASAKCLIKCATFPRSKLDEEQRDNEVTPEVMTHGADVKSSDLPCTRSISLPTPLKLVSAIRGGREKQGKSPRKLSVTWAPDVYDPIPTAVSHVPNKGQSRKSGKRKNGKNKQKNNGKSSRGGKGKDKKQARKQGVTSPPSDSNNNITDSCSEVQSSIVDFDIDRPDPFCGSSFLKNSITEMHFSVAEAT